MKNRTVFLVVQQGFSARYLLRSEFFKVLKNNNVRVVIISPNAEEEYFQQEFFEVNTFIEKYDFEKYDKRNEKLKAFFSLARLFSHNNKYFINFPRYWYRHHKQTRNNKSLLRKVYNFAFDVMVTLLDNFKLVRKVLPIIESCLTPGVHKNLFQKYKPDVVITTSMGTLPYDRFIMHEARRHRAKVVPFVLSWDNTMTKGLAGAKVDYVVAWTEMMKTELINYHEIDPNDIFVGGVTQYDEYFKNKSLMTKQEVYQQMGLDPERKLVFYCLESPTQYPWNLTLLEMLARLIEIDAFGEPVQILARLHPIYFTIKDGKRRFEKEIEELIQVKNKFPNIHFDYPEILSQKMGFDMPKTEVYKLGGLLKHADLVLCFYSSIMIESSIFDTPVVNIALYHKNNLPNEVMGNHNHNKRVLATGGVSTVFTEADLISTISSYLKEPSLDESGRKKIVEQEAGPNRGKAGRTIAKHLIRMMEKWS